MTHYRHTPPDPQEIERQQRREARAVTLGIQRMREQTTGLADSASGKVAIREVMAEFVPALRSLQEEAAKGIAAGGKGRQPEIWWLVHLLPAEKIAYITLRALMASEIRGYKMDRHVTGAALAVASAVHQEMGFERWVKEQKQANKDAKESGDEDHHDLLSELKRWAKPLDSRSWARWSTKIKRVRDEPWPTEVKVMLGEALLVLMCQHSGGWFEMIKVTKEGKTVRVIQFSEEARQAMEDIDARAELTRPVLVPMVVKPRPWVWVAA